jgi:oligosaccharide repeat unit polymerase
MLLFLVMAGSSMAAGWIIVTLSLGLEFFQLNSFALVVLIVGAAVVSLCYRLTRDWLSPPFLLISVWTAVLFLVNLDVRYTSYYDFFNEPLLWDTWLVIIGALLCFLLGSLIVLKPHSRACRQSGKTNSQQGWDNRKVWTSIILSFVGGLGVFAYSVWRAGTVPILAETPSLAAIGFRPPFWNNFYSLFIIVIVLAAIRTAGFGGWRRNWAAVVLAILSFAALISTLERHDAWQSFVIAIVVWILVRRNQQILRPSGLIRGRLANAVLLSAAAFLLLAAFVQVAEVRGLPSNQIVEIPNYAWAQIYLYSGAPAIKNFQWVIHGHVDFRYGALLLRPILWYLRIRQPVMVENIFVGPNTATFLYYYFLDFGYVGTLLVPLTLGFLCAIAYRKACESTSMLWITWYSLLVSCIVFTPTGERFFEPSTLWYALLFAAVDRYCRLPMKKSTNISCRELEGQKANLNLDQISHIAK